MRAYLAPIIAAALICWGAMLAVLLALSLPG